MAATVDNITDGIATVKIKPKKVVGPPVNTATRTSKQVIHIPHDVTHFDARCYTKAKKLTGGESIHTLDMHQCFNIEILPRLTTLRVLNLHATKISELNLPPTLKRLRLSNCSNIKKLEVQCKDLYIVNCNYLRTIKTTAIKVEIHHQVIHEFSALEVQNLTLVACEFLDSVVLPVCQNLAVKSNTKLLQWANGSPNRFSAPAVQHFVCEDCHIKFDPMPQCVSAKLERCNMVQVGEEAVVEAVGVTFCGPVVCSRLSVRRCNVELLEVQCMELELEVVNAELVSTAARVVGSGCRLTGVLRCAVDVEFRGCTSVPVMPVAETVCVESCRLRSLVAPRARVIRAYGAVLPVIDLDDYCELEDLEIDDTVVVVNE